VWRVHILNTRKFPGGLRFRGFESVGPLFASPFERLLTCPRLRARGSSDTRIAELQRRISIAQ
jgi:hypothetical protein